MGISGLLQVLKSITTDRHLSSYRGKRIAVDGYCWLHKSVYTLFNEIIDNPSSTKYLQYLQRRLDHLLKYEIIPVIIFDGDKLPMKKNEEDDREKHRNEVKNQGELLKNQGLLKEAQTKMIEGIDINPQMAYEFIKEWTKRNIEYFVAPYEADVQLAYWSKINYVDCIITEDSDWIALGCKRILFKLDMDSDICQELVYDNIFKIPSDSYSFQGFSQDKFLTFCIFCGCDYFKIKNVGYSRAYKWINESRNYLEVLRNWREKKFPINEEKIEEFEKAFLTFKYQTIYCPIEKKMKNYNEIDDKKYPFLNKYKNNLCFLGKKLDDDLTKDIVFAVVDPITHIPFDKNIQRSYHLMSADTNVKEQKESPQKIPSVVKQGDNNENLINNLEGIWKNEKYIIKEITIDDIHKIRRKKKQDKGKFLGLKREIIYDEDKLESSTTVKETEVKCKSNQNETEVIEILSSSSEVFLVNNTDDEGNIIISDDSLNEWDKFDKFLEEIDKKETPKKITEIKKKDETKGKKEGKDNIDIWFEEYMFNENMLGNE